MLPVAKVLIQKSSIGALCCSSHLPVAVPRWFTAVWLTSACAALLHLLVFSLLRSGVLDTRTYHLITWGYTCQCLKSILIASAGGSGE